MAAAKRAILFLLAAPPLADLDQSAHPHQPPMKFTRRHALLSLAVLPLSGCAQETATPEPTAAPVPTVEPVQERAGGLGVLPCPCCRISDIPKAVCGITST